MTYLKHPRPFMPCLFATLSLTQPLFTTGLLAQPPEPPRPPKPTVPPISLAEADKVFGEPTRVTLHLKDVTSQEVIKEFSKQSGVTMRLETWREEEAKKQVTVDIENQPFWVAMQEVCATLNMSPQTHSGRDALLLHQGDISWARGTLISLSPLVTLRLIQITRTHTIALQGDATVPAGVKAANDTQDMALLGTFLFDPKLRMAEDRMRITIPQAIDDKGVTLVNENQRTYSYTYGQSPLLWTLKIPLIWRGANSKQIVKLRVSAKCFVTTRRELWEVPDVLNARESSKTLRGPDGDETYTFLGMKKIGSQYQVHLDVQRPPARARVEMQQDEQPLLWIRRDFSRMATLRDAEGRRFAWRGNQGTQDQDEYRLLFAEVPEGMPRPIKLPIAAGLEGAAKPEGAATPEVKIPTPEKLVLDIPLEFRELEVPFELKDIPLP